MDKKKEFKIYYLLLTEGTTEFNLFAYLTKNKFREDFEKSNIKFSDKITITDIDISRGKLNGFGNLASFKGKYIPIKEDDRYKGEKLFFIIDKDLDDSLEIESFIKKDGHIVQFIEYNSEFLLLKLGGKNPKLPSDFNNMKEFRDYCKVEFKKHFKKEAQNFKDIDFDSIFNNTKDEDIKNNLKELFFTTN